MSEQYIPYPNISWAQFEMINDNRTDAFEAMCKELFIWEYLHDSINPHADHNNPGVEVVPILEPPRTDGQPRRYISYQAKYFENNISDSQVIHSLQKAVEYYAGRLDVIYLFCNKVISTGTQRFEKYVKTLNPANIKLELVTDKDIFVLVRKYPRVANYYFRDRTRDRASSYCMMGNVTFSSNISESVPSPDNTHIIIHELLKEKIERCKDIVFNLEFSKLESELERMSKIGADSGPIHFYRILLAAHNKEDFTGEITNLTEELKEQAYWLKSFVRNTREISIDEYTGLSAEIQIAALDHLFSSHHWNWIVKLYEGRERVAKEALKMFDYHVALSQFNIGECDKAHKILSSMFSQYHEQIFHFYDICSLLHKANREYIFGVENSVNTIKELLGELDTVREQVKERIKCNEPMIAVLEMQACFNIGATEKLYLDQARARYENYSAEIKANHGVRFFSGLCFEMAGDLEHASQLFSECAWRSEEMVASRYLTSLIYGQKYIEAVSAFDDMEETAKTPRIEAIYLLALYRMKDADYKDKLRKVVDKCEHSLSDLLLIGIYVEDSSVFDEFVLPKLKPMIPVSLRETDIKDKVGLLALLAHNNQLDLMEHVLDSIQDINIINRFVIRDIYKCLFKVANKEYEARRHNQIAENDLRTVEKIADRFIEGGILKKDYTQIKLLCASANDMVFSMLKYSKELFEYTRDISTARNIVALLCERNANKVEEYEPYLTVLMESEDPGNSMAVAYAMEKLGRMEGADYYAYKAIYDLNGTDDYDVYRSLFGYFSLTLYRRKEKKERKTISSNMVVTLESEGEKYIFALDSEDGFGEAENHSLDVEHIGRKDPIYVKLIGKGRGQLLNLREKGYKVVDFVPRDVFIANYIYKKVIEHHGEYKGAVTIISAENKDEIIKQLLVLSDRREQLKTWIDLYHSETYPLGIPIDFFARGDYERYINFQRYLLYEKDQAYYAGEPRMEFIVNAKYVPALSTLVLLASNDWLHTLDWLADHVVIPESYMFFFREQYARTVENQAVSSGSLIPLDNGKFTIREPDKTIPEIWEKIINKCEQYPTEVVTDDERITYEILHGYTYERLFAGIKMDKAQLDALILAERLNGVYYCDDLFFRRLAAFKNIKNINFATLLYAYDDIDSVMPILMELSKTNYIFTPFRFRNIEECRNLVTNLLDGEKKRKYYLQFFEACINVGDQIMKHYFEEEQPDEDEKS